MQQRHGKETLMLDFLLYLAALVCFGLAAFGVPARRVSLVPLGLGFWVLVSVIKAWPG
jgi:hypothetical protein